jgi:hypothetical protein
MKLAAAAALVCYGLTSAHAEIIAEMSTFIVTPPPSANASLYSTPAGQHYDGVAGLTIYFTGGGGGLCTGSLLSSWDILTAAHCITDGAGNLIAASGTATLFLPAGGAEVLAMSSFAAHPLWDGDPATGNDVAMIRLAQPASSSLDTYGLYTSFDEIGQAFEVVGYGRSGTGYIGTCSPAASCGGVAYGLAAGTRRRGNNSYDATVQETFDVLGYTAGAAVLVSDFDNGLEGNDAMGYFFGIAGLGLGANEVTTAPGDSGGPSFINGRIAGITSYGLRLSYTGGATSDVTARLDSSFGEFAAYTRVSYYEEWIHSQMVPEPETYSLLLLGGACMAALHRRKAKR